MKISDGQNNRKKLHLNDFWSRFSNYVLSSFVVLAVYFVFMLALNTFARQLLLPDENGEVFFSFLGKYGWWIIYALAYAIPLYFIRFRRDGELRTFVLHITENDYDIKEIFKQFTIRFAVNDVIIYAIYSALLLLPFKNAFDNPAGYITIHQMLFYLFPIPRIASYLLAVACFIPQYYACFWFAQRYYIKNRLRKK